MAASVRSVATTNFVDLINSITISKPANLAVGDLLFAIISRNGAGTLTPPSGWTLLRTDVGGGAVFRQALYYKVATASDVAASNFQWTWDVTDFMGGAIFAITGHNPNHIPLAIGVATATDTANPSFANGITPFIANSLLLIIAAGNGNDNAIGGYAIATSNPSWTELVDMEGAAYADGPWMAAAWATRVQVTATGNSSITGGEATMDSLCYLVAFAPDNSISITDTVTLTDQFLAAFAIFITEIANVTDSLLTVVARLWSKVTKNSSTWNNQDKS